MRWLHVHPEYVVTDDSWAIVRLASLWQEGVMPEHGGLQNQVARLAAAIDRVLQAWAKMRAAEDKARRR